MAYAGARPRTCACHHQCLLQKKNHIASSNSQCILQILNMKKESIPELTILGCFESRLLHSRSAKDVAREMVPFFGIFHDLVELLTELASVSEGSYTNDGGVVMNIESSDDISEHTLFRGNAPGIGGNPLSRFEAELTRRPSNEESGRARGGLFGGGVGGSGEASTRRRIACCTGTATICGCWETFRSSSDSAKWSSCNDELSRREPLFGDGWRYAMTDS